MFFWFFQSLASVSSHYCKILILLKLKKMLYRNFTWRMGEGTNSRTFYKYIDVKLLLVLFSSYWRFLITFKINLASEDFDILIFWRFLDSISKDTNMFFVKFFGKSIVCFSSHSWKITILFDLKKIY